MYYRYIKPIIPRRLQIFLRQKLLSLKRPFYENVWPIDPAAAKPVEGWLGWPEGKKFALVLTHDVETEYGTKKCSPIIDLERSLGFKSSFNFVSEGYPVSKDYRRFIENCGFEVGLHGLVHDGYLFKSRKIFLERLPIINEYLREWGARGFRSPSMYRNLEWILDFDIDYDASTFDTDPFEPQPGGVCTIFPFWVGSESGNRGYVELPYTLPQDFTLFILLKEKDINIWKTKLDWIASIGGMALVDVHPDYINFDEKHSHYSEYPSSYYEDFLMYVKTSYQGQYWHVLPREMAKFWAENYARRIKQPLSDQQ